MPGIKIMECCDCESKMQTDDNKTLFPNLLVLVYCVSFHFFVFLWYSQNRNDCMIIWHNTINHRPYIIIFQHVSQWMYLWCLVSQIQINGQYFADKVFLSRLCFCDVIFMTAYLNNWIVWRLTIIVLVFSKILRVPTL